MYRSKLSLVACLFLSTVAILAPFADTALAEDTRITVMVISRAAKFVGSSMGGVQIQIEDADTGQVLATGVTEGSTGDTDRVMRTEHPRDRVLSTPEAARFETTLDLDEPRRLRFTARGPLAQRQAMNEVSATQWVVPGKHLTGGDGFLLELPGFAVDVLSPPTHVRAGEAPLEVELRANVVMMCGCPITPGGLWDADGYEIRAMLHRNGEKVAEVPLGYAGQASQFAATWTAPEPGLYRAVVYAYDQETGNTGVDETTFIVQR